MGYAWRYWPLILLSIVLGVIKFAIPLAVPHVFGKILDQVILLDDAVAMNQRMPTLLWALGGLSVALVLRIPVGYLRGYCAQLAGNRTIFDIRNQLYAHIQRLSLNYHAHQRSGAMTSRLINDVNTAQGILDRGVMSVWVDLIFLLIVVVLLLVKDLHLALVSLAVLPVYGLCFTLIRGRLRKTAREAQRQMSKLSGEANEKISGLAVVIAFVREKAEQRLFLESHQKYFGKVMKRVHYEVLMHSFSEFLTLLGPMVVVTYGAYRCIQGHLTPGELVAFHGFLAQLYLPTRRLSDASAALQVQLAAMDRVFALMDVEPEIQDAPDAVPLAPGPASIAYNHVDFAYHEDQPVLKDISFSAEAGQAVAFVGRSGAGKTTLVHLAPRFYDIAAGNIQVRGQDIQNVTLQSLRGHIGIVAQDVILFSGSIRDNILYGREGASEEEMLEAARMAHVDEFVEAFPKGYDTIIGERGITLSGGQKQRLSIARAFLRDPEILILDEATSNLDSHSENIIQEALAQLMQGRTTLVIAHRLSTITHCDQVLVMEAGRIIQRGTHDSLIAQPGPYRALCEEQFSDIMMEELPAE
jgi:ATP-binding cassette, subfamily B, putative efflux pump